MGDLGHGGLHPRPVEVGKECIFERRVVVLEHACKLQELLAAVGERTRLPGLERCRESGVVLCAATSTVISI